MDVAIQMAHMSVLDVQNQHVSLANKTIAPRLQKTIIREEFMCKFNNVLPVVYSPVALEFWMSNTGTFFASEEQVPVEEKPEEQEEPIEEKEEKKADEPGDACDIDEEGCL